MALRVTQIGAEVWIKQAAGPIRDTQVGAAPWIAQVTGPMRVTQVGVETWINWTPFTPPPHGHGPPQPPPKSGQIRHTGYKLQRYRREYQGNITGHQFLAWNPVSRVPEVLTEDKWHQAWSTPRTLRLRGIHPNKTLPLRTGLQQDFIPAGPKEVTIGGAWISVEINSDVFPVRIDNIIPPKPPFKVRASVIEVPAIRRAASSLVDSVVAPPRVGVGIVEIPAISGASVGIRSKKRLQ